MPPEIQAWLPIILIAGLFLTLLREWLEPDVAAWSAVGLIIVLGLLPVDKVLQAFANPAPVTVACMFVLGAAMEKNGVVAWVGHFLGRFTGATEWSVLLVFCGFAALVSAFLNNTAVVAVLMPVALSLAKQNRLSASKLLLPLSYAAILGGTCTLIGTSTNLSVQGVLMSKSQPLLTLFEITPLGLVFAGIGVLYLVTIGRKLLPAHAPVAEEPAISQLPPLYQYVVLAGSPLIGSALTEKLLAGQPALDVLEVRRRGVPLQDRLDKLRIRAGDRLLLTGTNPGAAAQDRLLAGTAELGLQRLEPREQGAVEAVVPADSNLEGKLIGEEAFRQRFATRVAKLVRDGEAIEGDLGQVELTAGDQILVMGPIEGVERMLLETELVRIATARETPKLGRRGWLSAGVFLAFVAGVALHDFLPGWFPVPIEGVALLSVVAIMLTRSLQHRDLYQSVNWHIVFLISGMLIVGAMLEHTGTAARLAGAVAGMVNGGNPWLVVSLTYLAAMILTELISNNAVATMLTPIAISLADQIGVDPRPLVMAVLFAASASFSTPVGYQTNTFIYGVGGYRFTDFFRVGAPLNLILWIVASVLIPVFWPLK